MPPYPTSWSIFLILSSNLRLGLSSGFFFLTSHHENLVGTCPMSHTCHMTHPSHSPWFDHPNNIHVWNLKSHLHCLCCTKGSVRGIMKCLVTSFWRWGFVSTSPNSHLGGPLLVGRPGTAVQYNHGYSPYLQAGSSVRDPSARHAVVIGIHLSWRYVDIVLSIYSRIIKEQGLLLVKVSLKYGWEQFFLAVMFVTLRLTL